MSNWPVAVTLVVHINGGTEKFSVQRLARSLIGTVSDDAREWSHGQEDKEVRARSTAPTD